jgi:hypothetical protein
VVIPNEMKHTYVINKFEYQKYQSRSGGETHISVPLYVPEICVSNNYHISRILSPEYLIQQRQESFAAQQMGLWATVAALEEHNALVLPLSFALTSLEEPQGLHSPPELHYRVARATLVPNLDTS